MGIKVYTIGMQYLITYEANGRRRVVRTIGKYNTMREMERLHALGYKVKARSVWAGKVY